MKLTKQSEGKSRMEQSEMTRLGEPHLVTGTLDDFMERAGAKPVALFDKLRLARNQMNSESVDLLYESYEELQELGYIPQIEPYLVITEYVDMGFIQNACDSLITRMEADQQFQAEMKMTTTCDGNVLSFRVEDNGTGIDPETQPLILKRIVSSKKPHSKLRPVYYGGQGAHMFEAKQEIKELGGTIYFENKGYNKGAIFWYQIPVEALKTEIMIPV